MKKCSKCGKDKPLSAFSRRLGGRTLKPRVRPSCKECEKKDRQRWYAENRDKADATSKRYAELNPARTMLTAARGRARKKGLDFDLTVDDLIPLPDTCPVLGIPLVRSKGRYEDGSYTLDRIDNSKGYVRGNVLVVSRRANVLKRDATVGELKKLAEFYAGKLSMEG